MSIADLRRKYTLGGIDHGDLADDPIEQFTRWFEDAQNNSPGEWFEVNAMTLATAAANGEVSARIVLLKHYDHQGFTFYTNYNSQKGQQLADNPNASLVFYWGHLERQIRINGKVKQLPHEQSEAYFHSRPRGSQLGALASNQSQVIPNRNNLEQGLRDLEAKYANKPIPLPDWWGGYRLEPSAVEFWQGRDNRLHDRFHYTCRNTVWIKERLAP
ncbi:MAG: pyridoxamine 5'-phosphate oxidase [Cyanobacteria bacterium P01_F01_bin.116]